jgi:ABC-2 type transport system permease protein
VLDALPRIVVALVRTSLLVTLQYRSDFLLATLTGIVRAATLCVPLVLVFGQRSAVGGWSEADALLVMGFYLILVGYQGVLLEPNLGVAVDLIRTGSFDLVLTKPVDAQLQVSLRKLDLAEIWPVVGGVGLVGWALAHRPLPSLADAAIGALMFVCGLAAVYGLWILALCSCFFFVRVDNLRFLLVAVTDAGRWPMSFFAGWVRWVLTLVVPVAIVTSFPATSLRGEWTAGFVATGVGVAAAFVIGSRLAWRWSVSRYSSASS